MFAIIHCFLCGFLLVSVVSSLGKENTVVFEDALHAVKTARSDGFPVAGVYDKEEENNQAELRREVNWYFRSLLEAVSYLDV